MPMRETQPQHLVSICKIKNISGHLGNSPPYFHAFVRPYIHLRLLMKQ